MAEIITQSEAATFLKLDKYGPGQEDQVKILVDGINAAVIKHCNRKLVSQDFTEWRDGGSRRILQLCEYPIISITSVTYYDESEAATSIASTDYWTDNDAGQLTLKPAAAHGSYWIKGVHNYKVVYKVGYAAASMPNDLKLACLTWIAVLWERVEHKRQTLASESFGDRNISYRFDKIPPEVESMLAPFARLPYA
jgi:uncharacterized phiE125 gp8 family phage protein